MSCLCLLGAPLSQVASASAVMGRSTPESGGGAAGVLVPRGVLGERIELRPALRAASTIARCLPSVNRGLVAGRPGRADADRAGR
jgi:hypothetical protein